MKRKLFLLYFNLSFVCVLLVMIELGGQVLFFIVKGHPLFDSHRTTKLHEQLFERHPYLVGRLKKNVVVAKDGKTITTTNIHTRWTGTDANSRHPIKIAVLGGSSTFGTGVTDADSWPALLQDLLGDRYSVTNYGVPGYSTVEAIVQMALIVPESRPNVVVLYEGWNDIRNYHDPNLGPDYFSHGMKQYENLNISPPGYTPLMTRLGQLSAICRFASLISKKLPHRTKGGTAGKGTFRRTEDSTVDALYLRNLKTLKVLAQHMGAYALFVPQVLNEADFRGKKGSREWSPGTQDDAMPALLDQFNLIMKKVCGPGETDCAVLDQVDAERWTPDDFIDDGHFSRTGGTKFARLIAKHIRENVSEKKH